MQWRRAPEKRKGKPENSGVNFIWFLLRHVQGVDLCVKRNKQTPRCRKPHWNSYPEMLQVGWRTALLRTFLLLASLCRYYHTIAAFRSNDKICTEFVTPRTLVSNLSARETFNADSARQARLKRPTFFVYL